MPCWVANRSARSLFREPTATSIRPSWPKITAVVAVLAIEVVCSDACTSGPKPRAMLIWPSTPVGSLTPTGVDHLLGLALGFGPDVQASLPTTPMARTATTAIIFGQDGRIEVA